MEKAELLELLERETKMRGLYREGVDAPDELAGSIILNLINNGGVFKNSAFTKGYPVTGVDIEIAKEYQRRAARLNPWVFNGQTQRTNFLVAKYAGLLGGLFNQNGYQLSLNELRARAHLHDLGRSFTHRRWKNDLVGDLIMTTAGFTPSFMASMPSDDRWWPVDVKGEPTDSVEAIDRGATMAKYADLQGYDTDSVKGVLEMADILGKFVGGRRLMRWEELEEVSLRSRLILPDQDKCGPMEFIRQTSVVENIDGIVEFYRKLGVWVESQIGIPMREVVERIDEMLTVEPLPKTYHQERGRFLFDTVIWDLGGVVFEGGATKSLDPLVDPILQAYGVTEFEQKHLMSTSIEELLKSCNMGFRDHLVDRELWQRFGNPKLPFSMVDIFQADAQSYSLNWDTVGMIKFLENEGIRTIIASNTIESGFPIMLDALTKAGVKTEVINNGTAEEQRRQIEEVEAKRLIPTFGSYIIQTRKGDMSERDDGKKLFEVIRDAVGIEKGKTVVVDDRPAYADEGSLLGIGYTFVDPSQFEQWVINRIA